MKIAVWDEGDSRKDFILSIEFTLLDFKSRCDTALLLSKENGINIYRKLTQDFDYRCTTVIGEQGNLPCNEWKGK